MWNHRTCYRVERGIRSMAFSCSVLTASLSEFPLLALRERLSEPADRRLSEVKLTRRAQDLSS
jgi:hypothetical protein